MFFSAPLPAQTPRVDASRRAPESAAGLLLLSEPAGNLLVLLGSDGPLVVGPQAPSLVAKAHALLVTMHAGPARYVLVTASDSAAEYGDGGWGAEGALTIAQEGIRGKIRVGGGTALPTASLRPRVGFSEVLQLALNDDEIHAVHQPAGFSDADVSVHFEHRRILYLGNLFTTDGYPSLDLDRGGSLAGLITAADRFLKMFGNEPAAIRMIVPGRGPAANLADLGAFRDMLVAVREQIAPQLRAGATLEAILASRPTREFDERWGRGPVTPDQFVRLVYRSLAAEAASAPTSK